MLRTTFAWQDYEEISAGNPQKVGGIMQIKGQNLREYNKLCPTNRCIILALNF